jgi:hypothetical protein
MANPVGKTARSVTESNFRDFGVGFRRTLVTNGGLLKVEINFPGRPSIGVDPGCNNQPIDTSFGVDRRKVGRPAARLGRKPNDRAVAVTRQIATPHYTQYLQLPGDPSLARAGGFTADSD